MESHECGFLTSGRGRGDATSTQSQTLRFPLTYSVQARPRLLGAERPGKVSNGYEDIVVVGNDLPRVPHCYQEGLRRGFFGKSEGEDDPSSQVFGRLLIR